MQIDWTLTVITDRWQAGNRSQAEIIRAAIRGGVTAVQLRDKEAQGREMLELGQAIMRVTRMGSVPLIVNDRVDVVLALDAEGAHVGQSDLPAPAARRLLGSRLLGVSASNLEEALQAEAEGADYLGVGPVFATPSKADAGEALGVGKLAEIVRRVAIPVVAIGGISIENVGGVIEAGASGIAVIGAIVATDDPEQAARELLDRIRAARGITE